MDDLLAGIDYILNPLPPAIKAIWPDAKVISLEEYRAMIRVVRSS